MRICSFAGKGSWSFPASKRDSIAFKEIPASGALAWLLPSLHVVIRCRRADGIEVQPTKPFHVRKHQPIERRLKSWRRAGNFGRPQPAGFQFPFRKRIRAGHFQLGHSVVEFPAIPAKNRLDREMDSTIRAAGNLGSITAPGTFKQKRAAHAAIVIGDLNLRKADFELERRGWVWLNPCPSSGGW